MKNQTKEEGTDKDMKVLVYDLFLEAKSDSNENNNNHNYNTNSNMTSSHMKKKDDLNLKELVDILKKKENKIINLISELEELSENDPEIFKNLVAIRKDKNKETKLNIQKSKQKFCKIYFYFCFYLNI